MRRIGMIAAVLAAAALSASAQNDDQKKDAKNITIISAQTSADGKSTIAREVVEECILSLPAAGELEALTNAKTEYLRKLNGDPSQNQHMKVYAASVTINYLVRQKTLIIVTTNSVTAQEPVVKEVEKTVQKSQVIESDPNEGDVFSDISPRTYYFSTAEAAARNAKERARIWLKQHQQVLCPN